MNIICWSLLAYWLIGFVIGIICEVFYNRSKEPQSFKMTFMFIGIIVAFWPLLLWDAIFGGDGEEA